MNDNEFLAPVDVISTDKQLMESPEIETISKKIIKEYNLDFGPAEIGFFLVYPNISKQRAAKCMKATREVKYYSGNDYLIEVSGELWDMLDAKTKEMMIYHQLLHLDPSFKSKTQEWKMNLRKPHSCWSSTTSVLINGT